MITVLVLALSAQAANLDAGIFGATWGEQEKFPPQEWNCRPNDDIEFTFMCDKKIGDVPVEVGVAYAHNLFYAVGITAYGLSNCQKLLAAFTEAWGTPRAPSGQTGIAAEKFWSKGIMSDAGASWRYHPDKAACRVMAWHINSNDKMHKRKEAAAAKAAEGL